MKATQPKVEESKFFPREHLKGPKTQEDMIQLLQEIYSIGN